MNDVTVGQIIACITAIGIISGFGYKIFSLINQVKENSIRVDDVLRQVEFNTRDLAKLTTSVQTLEKQNEIQRNELMKKVEDTNRAVNLLCSAISAMIDNSLNDNKDTFSLKQIKQKLDENKGIV